jgi:hypothetical protein
VAADEIKQALSGAMMGWAFILFFTSHIYTWKFDSRKDCVLARGLFVVAYPVSRCFQIKEVAVNAFDTDSLNAQNPF